MGEILFLQYPKCSTCRKAATWLKLNGINFESRDIVEANPSYDELLKWLKISGLPVSKFFNTSGIIYRERNLKEVVKTASTEQLLRLLAEEGKLVKRPLLVSGNFVLVGFNEVEWLSKLK